MVLNARLVFITCAKECSRSLCVFRTIIIIYLTILLFISVYRTQDIKQILIDDAPYFV